MPAYPALLYSLFACLLLTACQSRAVLRTDGFYQSPKVEDYHHYIQFFEDDTAINVSAVGEPREVMSWFNKEVDYISKGNYFVKDARIFYTSKSKNGSVFYRIKIKANKLRISWHSLINEKRSTSTYRFIPFEAAEQN